jgi:hypothetical protein
MNELDRKKRNTERLVQVYPTFRVRLENLINLLEEKNLRPRIQDAWRSPSDQKKAFDDGYSKLLFGFHNVTAKDGTPESLAVDLLDDDSPLDSERRYLLQLAAAAKKVGLETGIRWGLPAKLVKAIDQAIHDENWDANIKIGWDPTHVQPSGISVSEAKAGKRPI